MSCFRSISFGTQPEENWCFYWVAFYRTSFYCIKINVGEFLLARAFCSSLAVPHRRHYHDLQVFIQHHLAFGNLISRFTSPQTAHYNYREPFVTPKNLSLFSRRRTQKKKIKPRKRCEFRKSRHKVFYKHTFVYGFLFRLQFYYVTFLLLIPFRSPN